MTTILYLTEKTRYIHWKLEFKMKIYIYKKWFKTIVLHKEIFTTNWTLDFISEKYNVSHESLIFFTENRNEILAIMAGVFSVVLLVVLLLLGGLVRRQRKRKLSSLDNRLLFGETNPDNPYNQIERAMLTAYVSPNVSIRRHFCVVIRCIRWKTRASDNY